MTDTQVGEPAVRKPLRVWPGVAIVVVQWVMRFLLPPFFPETMVYGAIAGLAGGLAILLWWLFFSRAPWVERIGAVVLIVAAMLVTKRVAHESISTGAMGMLLPMLAVPVLSLALVVWAVATRGMGDGVRRVTMAAAIVAACGVWTLVRTGGFTGNFQNDLHWRWQPTAEDRLVAVSRDVPVAPVQPAAKAEVEVEPVREAAKPAPAAEWPKFRGPDGDGVVRNARIQTNWSENPPAELWRRAVGPAWSSFAVSGDLIYTQEQRGPDEVVSCYRMTTGKPVWMHKDAARFWESNAGAGPRGTPTLDKGRVYTFGGTGILNALDAASGAVAWSRNAANEAETELPTWGYSSSPLVVGDTVIVAASGRMVAYDAATGARRWMGPKAGASYSSPRLVNRDGAAQVLLVSAVGLTSVAPEDGTQLWQHAWKGYPIVQPGLTPEGDVLISVADQSGLRRLTAVRGQSGWAVEERWTSKGLKPYFNDFVVHKGNAYGFDGAILSCIGLDDGQRKWKGGRYGNGQMVLLEAQDLMLVLSEEGEVALVAATPDKFTEVARFKAIEGKTWNHPVVAGDVLLVRNSEEMAAFRLKLER